jgi:hypothetical protein
MAKFPFNMDFGSTMIFWYLQKEGIIINHLD